MIKITFPDGATRKYESGVTALDIATSISEGLARNVLAATVDGEVRDLMRPIESDATLQLHTWKDKEGKSTFWHSSAHLLAEAIEALFPGTKFGIGPAIDQGFYYDIDMGDKTLSSDDFGKIEAKFKELASQKNEFVRSEVSKADAIAYFKEKGDGKIKAIKVMSLAGAYWRGDESRKQMTRVYGITFPKQKELTQHLAMLEEAKKRDHRKLGAELGLFMFSERVGNGLPIWLPKGTALRTRLEDFLKKEQLKRGYQPVITPHIGMAKTLFNLYTHREKERSSYLSR